MTSNTLDPVVDGDATLRALALSDLETTLAWRNDAESRHWFHSTDAISADQHLDWFTRYLERADDYMFILEASGRAAAQVSLYDAAGGSAEFGRLLVDPAQRGRGLSHRAIALCLHIADDVLRLAEVHLEVKGDNLRAIRAYEAAGFIHDEARSGVGGSLVMTRNHP